MKSVTKRLLSDLGDSAPTTGRLASSAHEVINEAAVKSAPIEKKLRASAVEMGEQLETSKTQVVEQLDQTLEQLQSFVKGRPMAAAGIAFATGVVATVLLRRRGRTASGELIARTNRARTTKL